MKRGPKSKGITERLTIRLTPEHKLLAKIIGNGSLSKGIRKSLETFEKKLLPERAE